MAQPVEMSPQFSMSSVKTEEAMRIELQHRCTDLKDYATILFYPIHDRIYLSTLPICSECGTTEYRTVKRERVKK